MKKLLTVAVILALWTGYSLGYYYGRRNEEMAWIATSVEGMRDSRDEVFIYRNPHCYEVVEGYPAINRVDLQVLEQYQRGLSRSTGAPK